MDSCGACGAENRVGARFCAACGERTQRTCSACGGVVDPAARFCDRCGTALDPGAGPAPLQSRKVVTVVFTDLIDSTRAQEHMDPESVRRWMDRFNAVMRGEIEAHGGRLVKYLGDGVMALFGVPDVQEDDARRAVQTALAMQVAFRELVGSEPAGPRGLRIGVNTGEVVVSPYDDDVVGDAVNVAARLEQAAQPGEVLIGESTFRLVRLHGQFRALPPLTLKGKTDPVQAFRLVDLEPPQDATDSTAFVGRASELDQLTHLLDEAIESRTARLATIIGSPGVGKTRLAQELSRSAAGRARIVELRCDRGGATFAPVATVLRATAALEEDADLETSVAAFTALFDEHEPDRDRVAAVAAGVLGVGEPAAPEEAFWAVRRLVEHTARRLPIVLFFDDVHWAEPLLLDLIENLVEWTHDAPVLVVLTTRPELRDLRPSLVEQGGRTHRVLPLEGLGHDESRRLACEVLATDRLPEALIERVADASEGNPLFVGELLRMLVDDGVLRQEGDDWVTTVDLAELDVPVTIHALLSARIDLLDDDERAVLESGSVLGNTFFHGAVAAALPPEVRSTLDDTLERLRRKELIRRSGTSLIDEPAYRFHHVLIRDAAYRRMLKDRRAHLHELMADWLEAKVDVTADHADLIGFQLERAFTLRRDLGVPDEAVGRRAATHLTQAGRRALEADDSAVAAGFLARAIGCLPPGDLAAVPLLIDRCDALLGAGDVVQAVPAVEVLAALTGSDERLRLWVACFTAEVDNHSSSGSLAEAAAEAGRAADGFAALGDVAGEAKAHAVRADSLARLGLMGDCEAALDLALGAARRAGDRRRATAVLAGAPVAALWGPSPITRATGRCLDVVRVLRITSRSPAVEATSLRCQAVLEALRGRPEASRRMLTGARRLLIELGTQPGLLELDVADAMVAMLTGDIEVAEGHLRRARAGWLVLGLESDAAFAGAALAEVRIAQGDVEEALALTDESERLGGGDLRTAIAWRAARADALVLQGALGDAQRLAEEAVALAKATDALIDHAKALASLSRARLAAGDEADAQRCGQLALALYARKEASLPARQLEAFLGVQVAEAPMAAVPDPAEGPANAATRAEERANTALLAGDWDALAACYAPDIEMLDQRPLTRSELRGRGTYVEHTKMLAAFGLDTIEVEHRAVRGQGLTLSVVRWGDTTGKFLVDALGLAALDDDGLIAVNAIYDHAQWAEAARDLEDRFLAGLDPDLAEQWAPVADFLVALLARSWADLRGALHDELRAVDHRSVGWGQVDADGFVDVYRRAAPDTWFGVPVVIELARHGVLVRGEGRGTTDGRGEVRTGALIVFQAHDGLITSADYFRTDDLAGASARLDELRSAFPARPDPPRRGPGANRMSNAATRAYDAFGRALMAGDVAGMASLYAEDVVVTDHRPVVGTKTVGQAAATQVAAGLLSLADLEGWSLRWDPITIRGDDGAVMRLVASAIGITVEAVQHVEVGPDGTMTLADTFELDQLGLALEHLGCPPSTEPRNLAQAALARQAAGFVAGDLDQMIATLSPVMRFADRRPLVGLGESAGIDEMVEVFRAGLLTPPERAVVHHLAALGDHVTASEISFRGLGTEIVIAYAVEVDDVGRIVLLHTSEGGDHALAIEGAVDLYLAREAPAPVGGPRLADPAFAEASVVPPTSATAGIDRFCSGVFDAIAGLVEGAGSELVITDRRSVVGGMDYAGASITSTIEAVRGIGVTAIEVTHLAVRGDLHCLSRLRYRGDRAETVLLLVATTRPNGEPVRAWLLDDHQLDDALALLDEVGGPA